MIYPASNKISGHGLYHQELSESKSDKKFQSTGFKRTMLLHHTAPSPIPHPQSPFAPPLCSIIGMRYSFRLISSPSLRSTIAAFLKISRWIDFGSLSQFLGRFASSEILSSSELKYVYVSGPDNHREDASHFI